ncbi:GNAT family N-acetyltransferase [Salinispora arenicola]|uniref:GNAT family N-acetyltransferase n=1 Tax=Salinispora arenicola TaxID=168697 RepID=UPI000375878B|nr:GNAT family N-acetyltransferase [Salinispora arenicola]MCN0178067.1 GNAT family N-acetyltransferase [Salinispora arenicola]
MTATLRPAEAGDLDRIRRWRNHPQVRGISLTQHEIGPEEHLAWWSAVRKEPDRQVLIYLHGGQPAGVVTFTGVTSPDRAVTWGYYLDIEGLEERGELLSAWMGLQRAGIEHALGPLAAQTLGGETLADNTPVLALHRRFGFRVTRRYERNIDGTARQVVWTELSRST